MRQKEVVIDLKDLVDAGLYESEEKAMHEALRLLLKENPEYKIKLAMYRYQNEKISIGKAAEIAEVPWETMRDELNKNGIELRLAPRNIEELRKDCDTIWRFVDERNRK
jgi:predicted HTH domain antitoxin